MTHEQTEQAQVSLTKAATGTSTMNYQAIFEGFIAKGIEAQDIHPRENVFTFNAWKALGRSVKRGEHGVKVCTYVTTKPNQPESLGEFVERKAAHKFPRTTTVFHITQTEPTTRHDMTSPAA